MLKRRISELGVPPERIVYRVIHAAATVATKARIHRSDPEMLNKRSVIRTRTKRPDTQVRAFFHFLLVFVSPGLFGPALLHRIPNRSLSAGLLDIPSKLVDESFECVRAADAECSLAGAVRVQIRDSILLEFIGVRFDPLGGTQQSFFFAVPRTHNYRAFWPPALLEQFTKCTRGFHYRYHAARRIIRAVYPRIVMIAGDHPLIGIGAAFDS